MIEFTLKGWEDGEPFVKDGLKSVDRWDVQSAQEITIHFLKSRISSIRIHQNPHSNHLGGYLWTSSIVLCCLLEALCDGNLIVPGINHNTMFSFLELGSGVTGLPSIAASKLGKYAIASDIPELLNELERNVALNKDNGNLSAYHLKWSSDDACMPEIDAILKPLKREALSLDVVLLSDCIYSEASAEALVNTLKLIKRKCLEMFKSSPVILCMTEVRNQSAQTDFLLKAKECFQVTLMDADYWQQFVPEELQQNFINLYVLQ